MIRGYFGASSHRPFVDARVVFPRLGAAGDTVFLVDTGADRSLLMPADSALLGLDFAALRLGGPAFGVGGVALVYSEPAVLRFQDQDRAYVFELELDVAAPDVRYFDVPSLLGRDVLDRMDLVVRTRSAEVLLEPHSFDASEILGPNAPTIDPPLRRE